ncbi:MAG: 2-C-methyl-D-erythritol 2,4-cyclodiphosphate synthase [Elusimicrobia bacterium]|nr:2-C-methyl-D-erythritol 2,4-cyclodiphosphate synthase [Elusimicrobiota bacterium]
MKTGIGYDLHRLTEGREFILGGVKIDYGKGLLGHSDADVLIHAVCDALLGAAGLGDIGRHFPDTDDAYKGISSLVLLKEVRDKLEDEGNVVNNVDATIICEKPKLAWHVARMEENIAGALGIDAGMVNVKATTNEGLGAVGRGEAVVCIAVASIVGRGEN